MIPAWLKSVFDECASCSLDSEADRDKLAAAIVAKLTVLARPMAACVSSAAHAKLGVAFSDEARAVAAKLIGADGATSILMLLEAE